MVQITIQVMSNDNKIDSITCASFPTATELNKQLYEKKFNRVLEIIMLKINESTNFIDNPNFVRIQNFDFNNPIVVNIGPVTNIPAHLGIYISSNIISDVKKFLIDKGYIIVDIENAVGESTGWKLSW